MLNIINLCCQGNATKQLVKASLKHQKKEKKKKDYATLEVHVLQLILD